MEVPLRSLCFNPGQAKALQSPRASADLDCLACRFALHPCPCLCCCLPRLRRIDTHLHSMGVKAGRLNQNLEMQIRAERGATLMIDSTLPVKLLPSDDGNEFGIGIHASIENNSLLVITPDAHVPHLDAWSGLWTRYDLSPGASLVSVQLADLKAQAARRTPSPRSLQRLDLASIPPRSRPLFCFPSSTSPHTASASLACAAAPKVGGRYTSRTRVHHTETGPVSSKFVNEAPEYTQFQADDSLSHIGVSCSLPSVSSCGRTFSAEPSWSCDWTYGRRFKGLVMGSPTTNVIATVLLCGPRAHAVTSQFRDLDADLAFLDVNGRWTSKHSVLGLRGDAHLALQNVSLANDEQKLVVARISTEHREDMHRLLHHCLAPLEAELGVAPYARMLKASRTASSGVGVDAAPTSVPFVDNPNLHVQQVEMSA